MPFNEFLLLPIFVSLFFIVIPFVRIVQVMLSTSGVLTVCVTCGWAGVDKVWEQEKLEAWKMLENAAESHTSGARFVGQFLC